MTKTNTHKNLFIVRIFISIVFFTTLISTGIYSLTVEDRAVSDLENRQLTKMSDVESDDYLSDEIFKKSEQYFNDQLVLRDSFIRFEAAFRMNVLRQDIIDSIYIDKSGSMYEAVPSHGQNPKQIAKRVSDFTRELKQHDVDFLFAPAPNKATFYEGELPNYLADADYGNYFMDQLLSSVSSQTHKLDLRDSVEKASKENLPYFKTDHHWTIDTVFVAYRDIINALNDFSDGYSSPKMKSDFNVETYTEDPFYGSFARRVSLTGYGKDYIKIYTPKNDKTDFEIHAKEDVKSEFNLIEKLENPSLFANRYEVYGMSYPKSITTNKNAPNNRKLLILKDSYVRPMLQFLSYNVEELHAIDMRHYDTMSILDYVLENDIDDVVFLQNNLGLAVNKSTSTFN